MLPVRRGSVETHAGCCSGLSTSVSSGAGIAGGSVSHRLRIGLTGAEPAPYGPGPKDDAGGPRVGHGLGATLRSYHAEATAARDRTARPAFAFQKTNSSPMPPSLIKVVVDLPSKSHVVKLMQRSSVESLKDTIALCQVYAKPKNLNRYAHFPPLYTLKCKSFSYEMTCSGKSRT